MSAGHSGDRKGSCGSSCGSVAHFACPAVYALGSWEVALTSHAHCGRSFDHQRKVKYAAFKPPFLFSRLMVHITNLSQSFFSSSEPKLHKPQYCIPGGNSQVAEPGCCSATQSCLTLCDLVDCSMLGFPVLHCQGLGKPSPGLCLSVLGEDQSPATGL